MNIRRLSPFFTAMALAILPLAACDEQLDAHDDARCRNFGAPPGTQQYFDCRMNLNNNRAQRSVMPAPAEPNLPDGVAQMQCDRRARQVAPYPIERLASSNVFPGTEKRVSLSYKIYKPGSSLAFWNVDCKFAGGAMTGFDAR